MLAMTTCTSAIYGQSITIFGKITDLSNQAPLPGALITCFNSIDSIKLSSTIAGSNGTYIIENIHSKQVYLEVRYLGYEITTNSVTTLGYERIEKNISLKKSRLILSEINVTAENIKRSVEIKSDTIQISARQYQITNDEMIETSLKRIPGFSISPNGTITYNGEQIKKILINGRLYFGNDVKMALKNVSSDLINKIQIIDTYSEESILTGNLAEKEKIINLTIRKDRKDKVQGQIMGGIGTHKRYASNLSLNKFTNAHNLSITGSSNNMNGYLDNDGPKISSSNSSNIGASYSGDISSKIKISATYQFENHNNTTDIAIIRHNIINDSSFDFQTNQNSTTLSRTNLITNRIEYNLDSTNKITFENYFEISNNKYSSNNDYTTNNGINLLNKGNTFTDLTENSASNSGTATYNKKLKQNNGNFSFLVSYNLYQTKQHARNISDNLILNNENEKISELVNQIDRTTSRYSYLRLTLSYSRNISKNFQIGYHGGYIFDKKPISKYTYNYDSIRHAYHELNDSLTNLISNKSNSFYANIFLRKNTGKLKYSFNWQFINVQQYSVLQNKAEKPISINTIQLFPSVYADYIFSSLRSLSLTFESKSILPDFTQINPVSDNSNPTIVRIGNRNLRAGTTRRMRLTYKTISEKTLNNLLINISTAVNDNQIVENRRVNNMGKQIIYTSNVDGINNFSFGIFNSRPLKNTNLSIDISSEFQYNKNGYLVNEIKSVNQTYTINQQLRIKYNLKNIFSAFVNGYYDYNIMKTNGTNKSLTLNTISINGNITAKLPLDAYLEGDILFSKITPSSTVKSSLYSNVAISKSISTRNNIILKLRGYNLLNTTNNITRTSTPISVEETRTISFGRIFLLNLIWQLRE